MNLWLDAQMRASARPARLYLHHNCPTMVSRQSPRPVLCFVEAQNNLRKGERPTYTEMLKRARELRATEQREVVLKKGDPKEFESKLTIKATNV